MRNELSAPSIAVSWRLRAADIARAQRSEILKGADFTAVFIFSAVGLMLSLSLTLLLPFSQEVINVLAGFGWWPGGPPLTISHLATECLNLLGYAASATVLATFCMRTMLPLRIVAICSNVLFTTFGALAHIYPILVLHIILCPINVVRLFAVAKPMSSRRLRLPVSYARSSPE
jgi:hypothetical protein